MVGCCILYCSNSSGKGFSMKPFPVNAPQRELWLKMIDRSDWEPNLKSRICEGHFTSEMWEKTEGEKKYLKSDAVPTIFPRPPPRVKNPEKRIIMRRKNERSVLSDHAYVNKPTEIEVRLPDLPKVVLQLNAEEAIQLKKIPEPKSILQRKLPSKNEENGVPTELIREEQTLVNRPIFPSLTEEQMKKRIAAQEKKILELQKKLTALRVSERKANREYGLYETILRSLFSEDQVQLLLSIQLGPGFSRSKKWSDTTIEKALRLKSICGNAGYEELLKLGYPFPSLRTLNRGKLKLCQALESSNETSVNISESISKKVFKKKVKVPKRVVGHVSNELIIDEKDPENEVESPRKKSKTEF